MGASSSDNVPNATNGDAPVTSSALPVASGGNTSFWRKNLHELDDLRSTEILPETSDVVIVGGGYAGVATAYHLLELGSTASITLVEARGACSGATGRNGGHMRPDLYGHIPKYIKRFGLEIGSSLAEFEIAHVQAIKAVVEKEKIDCEFTLTRTTDVWCDQDAADRAKAVYEMMVGHGLKYMDDVHFTYGQKAAEGVSGIKNAKACTTYTAGTMFPYKFILHLVGLLHKRGLNIQTHTPVTSVTPNEDGSWTVSTPRGHIKAGKVVHATNAYTKALLPEYAKNIVPCKGICCHIAVPQGSTPPHVQNSFIIRESGNPSVLSYLVPRGDGGIVVGGASSIFRPHLEQWYDNIDDTVLIESAKDYYESFMQKNFRGWEDSGARVTDIWTGVMGYSWDSNPHVGHVPGKEGQLIISGFNGHGMPIIWLAAKGLAEMIVRGKGFEETGMPLLLKTTKERIERAQKGPEGGDILA
ncbi:FAD dependent oxidoreductase superfamily [Pseudomassariella vexata]|uniref:FAD dependent oxidoreductase superfamily n=1 Tax=Pseudomassariella vexata TaxID=1141098 RepID=A0A1Y2DHG5_9PEZI|nr:FAD dependent oxidoreductase superfamily [Pseudomassariella vexata]ORY58576.1 FAD dependent oxidoreductase superfamily [Pseudomassariella vexata]